MEAAEAAKPSSIPRNPFYFGTGISNAQCLVLE